MSSSVKKKERKKERYLRNVKKELDYKEEAWNSGKLIEENHNGKFYSLEYAISLGSRLFSIVEGFITGSSVTNTSFLRDYVKYKGRIRDYIILCPKEARDNNYEFLKESLELYWDFGNNERLLELITNLYDKFRYDNKDSKN